VPNFKLKSLWVYDFTGGRIFDFPIDFCMGPYNSAALPVIITARRDWLPGEICQEKYAMN